MSTVIKELDLAVGNKTMTQTTLKTTRFLAFGNKLSIERAPTTVTCLKAWNIMSTTDMDRGLKSRSIGITVVRPPGRYMVSFLTAGTPESVTTVITAT